MIVVPKAPRPGLDAFSDAARALAEKARFRARCDDLDARDPDFIERILPAFGLLYDDCFRCETELEAPLPEGPFLAIANHNGMTGTPDMFCHMVAFWRLYGPKRRSHGLMHDFPFNVPAGGPWLNACGALAANHQNLNKALQRDAAVLVFPGGDTDACRPFSQRYRVDFGKRRGFVRAALRAQVPVVPIVSAGAHHSLYIWSDGQQIAKALRLPQIARSNVAPIGLALPFGIILGIPYLHLPLPVKVHTRILAPVRLEEPPSAADDPVLVERVYQRLVGLMQGAMNALRDEGRHGLFPRSAPA